MTKLTGIIDVENVVALRALQIAEQDNDKIYVRGTGLYDWTPASLDDDNDTSVIRPTGVAEDAPGRWVRLPTGGGAEWSRTLLVDGVSGLDTNDGYTQPVKTLEYARDLVGDGHTILIAEGEYAPQPLEIIRQNVTVAGMTPTGSGGVKTTVGAITAVAVGPKMAGLKGASLTLEHPAGNGAHTSGMQISGESAVNSPAFWEDHRSKFIGNVTLSGSGARYFYGSQFEGSLTAELGSGFVSFSDITGNNGILSIKAGVPYYVRNVTGFIFDIDPAAINVVDFIKLLGGTETMGQLLCQSHFSGVAADALHLAGRLTVAETAVANQTTNAEIAAAAWERSAALVFDQTTSGRTITLAQAMDGTVTHLRVFRNTGTVQMHIETHKLKPNEAVIGILPAGETDWIFVGGVGGDTTASSDSVAEVVNSTSGQLSPGDLVYIRPDVTAGGPYNAQYLSFITEEEAAKSPIVGVVGGTANVAQNARFELVRWSSGIQVVGINSSYVEGEEIWYRPSEDTKWGNTAGEFGNAVRLGLATTDLGTNVNTMVRLNTEWAASCVWQGNPPPRINGSVIDNTIANSQLVTLTGRYIVPTTGLLNAFVGHADEYADWPGTYDNTDPLNPIPNGFTFSVPANGDKVILNNGSNAGQVWTYTAANTPKWARATQTTAIPVSNYDQTKAYTATDVVIRRGRVYQANGNIAANTPFALGTTGATWRRVSEIAEWSQADAFDAGDVAKRSGLLIEANGNIPANTAFVLGTTGATWKPIGGSAEDGEQGLSSNVLLTNSVTTLLTANIPSAGVWEIEYSLNVGNDAGGNDGGSFWIANSIGIEVQDSGQTTFQTSESNAANSMSRKVVVTTIGPDTYTVRGQKLSNASQVYVYGGGRVSTQSGIYGRVGSSKVSWKKIAGFLPIEMYPTVPNWTDGGPIILGATTTAPTKPTVRVADKVYYKQTGVKTWQVEMIYRHQSPAGAASGSGDYLITLPNGLQFDHTILTQAAFTGNVGANSYNHIIKGIPSSRVLVTSESGLGGTDPCVIVPWDQTRFRVTMYFIGQGIVPWGSGWAQIAAQTGLEIRISFTFQSL